jgi:hypothetical protein
MRQLGSMGEMVKKTITIDQDLVDWVEKQKKQKKFRNLSHAVDMALYEMKARQDSG